MKGINSRPSIQLVQTGFRECSKGLCLSLIVPASMTERQEFTLFGRRARVLNLLIGVPLTVFGAVWLFALASSVQRTLSLMTTTNRTHQLLILGLLLLVGLSALLAGIIQTIQAFTAEPSATVFVGTDADAIDHPAKWVIPPLGVSLLLITITVWSSPATIGQPVSVMNWGWAIFSSNPAALFVIVVGFGLGFIALIRSND